MVRAANVQTSPEQIIYMHSLGDMCKVNQAFIEHKNINKTAQQRIGL